MYVCIRNLPQGKGRTTTNYTDLTVESLGLTVLEQQDNDSTIIQNKKVEKLKSSITKNKMRREVTSLPL